VGAEPSRRLFDRDLRLAAKPDYRALSRIGDDYDKYIAGRTAWQVTLKSGAVIPLYPGDKLNPFTPARPNPNQGGFVENCVRHLSLGTNLPYELVYKDFSKTDYSSARAALLEAWRTFTTRRAWIAAAWAQPWYELWLEEDINAVNTEAPDFYAQLGLHPRQMDWGAPRLNRPR